MGPHAVPLDPDPASLPPSGLWRRVQSSVPIDSPPCADLHLPWYHAAEDPGCIAGGKEGPEEPGPGLHCANSQTLNYKFSKGNLALRNTTTCVHKEC